MLEHESSRPDDADEPGGSAAQGEQSESAAEVREALARLRAWDAAPWTSHYELLLRQGVELPDAGPLTDRQVSAKLWEVIARLADRDVYVYHTDHLSDRELYELLVFEVLREPIKDLPPVPGTYFDIDLLGSGSDEDTDLLLKYYLSAPEREELVEGMVAPPPREQPPYCRDAYLPQPADGEDGWEWTT